MDSNEENYKLGLKSKESKDKPTDYESSFFDLFDFYFPHLKEPHIEIKNQNNKYTGSILLLGCYIENNKEYDEYRKAYNYLCELGLKFLRYYVSTFIASSVSYSSKLKFENFRSEKLDEDVAKRKINEFTDRINLKRTKNLNSETSLKLEDNNSLNELNIEEKVDEVDNSLKEIKVEKKTKKKETKNKDFFIKISKENHIKINNSTADIDNNSKNTLEQQLDTCETVEKIKQKTPNFRYFKEGGLVKCVYENEDETFYGDLCPTKNEAKKSALNKKYTKFVSEEKDKVNKDPPSIVKELHSSIIYSDAIYELCKNNEWQFPEYTFEKQNGVFICKAEFRNNKFSSRYFYDKNGAKEDVCRLIFNYIHEKEHQNNNNKPKSTKKSKSNRSFEKSTKLENDANNSFSCDPLSSQSSEKSVTQKNLGELTFDGDITHHSLHLNDLKNDTSTFVDIDKEVPIIERTSEGLSNIWSNFGKRNSLDSENKKEKKFNRSNLSLSFDDIFKY